MKEQTIEYAEGTSAKVVTVRRKRTIYERFVKRPLDIICALLAIICFCLALCDCCDIGKIKLGPLFYSNR